LSIAFQIIEGKLNMTTVLRSQDLVFGACNDIYCFTKLQELVSNKLGLPIGIYFNFAIDLHIYERHFNLKTK
jgi:thymidylate synthase